MEQFFGSVLVWLWGGAVMHCHASEGNGNTNGNGNDKYSGPPLTGMKSECLKHWEPHVGAWEE